MLKRLEFSIVVPTYCRPAQLTYCLNATARLDYPSEGFEVIVVDDGSPLPPVDVATRFLGRLQFTLLAKSHGGPAAARNAGARRARGRFLVFLDDDCVPDPGFLQTLADRLAVTPDHALGGRTINMLSGNPYSTASQLLVQYIYGYYNASPDRARFLATNNLTLPADRFRAVGGFDSTFLRASGEDREFCDRWLHHGYGMGYEPEAVVFHAHELTLRTFCRQHFGYGRGAFQFHQAHAQRSSERIGVEPACFYLEMMRYPLVQSSSPRSLLLAGLLILAQAANAAGFAWEAARKPRRDLRFAGTNFVRNRQHHPTASPPANDRPSA